MSVELNNTKDSVVLQATSGTCGISHYWNGTILTITSDSGTSACDLKGEKGDDGARGPMGLPGDANLTEAVAQAEAAAADAEAALSQLGTARDEAVAAADQVKTIVAGNEAYTKAESDKRFANAIKPTATGEVATAADSGNYPLQGLKIYGKTTQAGTPTPATPVDLVNIGSGGSISVNVCGKNMLDVDSIVETLTQNGITLTKIDGGFTLTGTATANTALKWQLAKPIPAGKYVLNARNTGISDKTTLYFAYADAATDVGNTTLTYHNRYGSFEAIQPLHYLKLYITSGTAVNITMYPMLTVEEANTNEAYKDGGSITINTPDGLPGIPVSSGGNYTDSNGQQWIADEIDLDRGFYIQRVKQINLDDIRWTYNSEYNMWISQTSVSDGMYGALYSEIVPYYIIKGTADVNSMGSRVNEPYNIWVRNGSNSIMPTGKALYALRIPIGETLTDAEIAAYKALQSQYPNTTVYTDSNAGIAATYVADTKNYIDNKFNELSTALVAMGG